MKLLKRRLRNFPHKHGILCLEYCHNTSIAVLRPWMFNIMVRILRAKSTFWQNLLWDSLLSSIYYTKGILRILWQFYDNFVTILWQFYDNFVTVWLILSELSILYLTALVWVKNILFFQLWTVIWTFFIQFYSINLIKFSQANLIKKIERIPWAFPLVIESRKRTFSLLLASSKKS